MKWRTASLLLVLTACGSPPPRTTVDHQEGPVPAQEEEATEVEAEEETKDEAVEEPAEEPAGEPVVVAEPEPEDRKAEAKPAPRAPVVVAEPVVKPEVREGVDEEVPVPQAVVAEQERVILDQQEQVQEMEDDLLGLYVEVLKRKCLRSGGSEEDCDSDARQEVEERYHAAEEAAEESAR